ncbi:MAG: RibD family protein [Planctomycetota bacterium]
MDDPGELWATLLALRALLQRDDSGDVAYLTRGPHAWRLEAEPPDRAETIVSVSASAASDSYDEASLPAFLRLYLPVILASARARRQRSVHVTGHLAQTLDGRIACTTGDSQWIGNPGNLRHAHRLRALHDAVLVGSGTVERDDPALTVRHVLGPNPRRVVLNGSASSLARQHELKVYADAGCILACAAEQGPTARAAGVEVVALETDAEGNVPIDTLLGALAARGLHSVFVEGGGRTLSSFFAAGRLDLLHLHVAPIILGSGVPSFELPTVRRLADAPRLRAHHFDVDGELLFVCACPRSE